MAVLELAKNAWWNTLTRDEQEQYLKDHSRSKLKITKRRPRKSKHSEVDDEQPSEQQTPQQSEQPEQKTEETPESTEPEKVAEDIKEIIDNKESKDEEKTAGEEKTLEQFDDKLQNSSVVELDDAQKEQVAEALSTEVADKMEPDKVTEQLSDEDKDELEADLEDAIEEEDEPKRKRKFALTALKLGLKLGIITAGVLVVGYTTPMAIFLPEVYGSIWSRSTDWSERGTSALETGLTSLHKVLKNKKAKKHIRHGMAGTGGE